MSPPARSTRPRALAIIVLLGLTVLGIVAFAHLPVDALPEPDAPRLSLTLDVPGLTAPVIEAEFTRPLEHALAGLSGISSMDSTTREGGLSIELQGVHRQALLGLERAVTERVQQLRQTWPASIDAPGIAVVDPARKVAEFILTSRRSDPLALRDWAEDELARRLRELPGVAEVSVAGGRVREIRVMPDQRRLAGYGLSFEDLRRALRQSPEMASGVVDTTSGRPHSRALSSGGVAALAALPVPLPDGESIRLSEVARLVVDPVLDPAPAGANDVESVRVNVYRLPSESTPEVAARVRAHVDWMRANRLIPEGIELQSHGGRNDEWHRTLRHVSSALLAGLVLIGIVYAVGRRARRGLSLGLAFTLGLPIVLSTMALFDLTLNVFAVGAWALGVGLFAGVGLIAPEDPTSPERYDPLALGVAIAASLAPVLFTSGVLAQYREFAFIFAVTALAAAVAARGIVPLFGRTSRRRPDALARWTGRLVRGYERSLRRLPSRSAAASAGAVLLVLAAVVSYSFAADEPVAGGSDRRLPIQLEGPDYTAVARAAEAIEDRLHMLPSIRRTRDTGLSWRAAWTLHPRPGRFEETGVDLATAGRALAIAQDGILVGGFRDIEHRYRIRLRLPPTDAADVAAGKILLLGEWPNRPAVYLRDVATLERSEVPVQIRHRSGVPSVEIDASVTAGYTHTLALQEARAALAGLDLAPDVRLYFGAYGADGETLRLVLLSLFAGAMASVFLIQAWWYRAWRPAAIAAITAGATLAATLLSMSAISSFALLPAMIFLIVYGVTAACAVLGWPWSEALGLSRRDLRAAWTRAARARFRLLSAFTLTTILGAAPLLWLGAAEWRSAAIGWVVGLTLSWVANLLLTPLVFWRFFAQGTN